MVPLTSDHPMSPDSTLSTSAFFLAMQLLFAGPVQAESETVWLIGGGPNAFRSQVQIERNVLWVLQAIDSLPGERRLRVFFTDGDEPTPDIHEWATPPETAAALQPLARVFDAYWSNGLQFRNHQIPGVAGMTEAGRLVQNLEADLRALPPGYRGWFLFVGHGTYSADLNNVLELWGDTGLNVSELGALLDLAPRQGRLRFLFTQCYSGAFAKLARPDTDRCGFLAAAPDQMSEGCSPAVEESDYEDYSTYFFAALTGRPRDHAGLDGIPDWNNDGEVTPLEAHYHVLATAFSADTPRTTSEVLLLESPLVGQPDLLADIDPDENDYMALAVAMMRRAGIDPDKEPGKEMHRRDQLLQDRWERLQQAQVGLRQEIVSTQQVLKQRLLRRWPEAALTYTRNFGDFVAEDLELAQAFIQAQSEYIELRRSQDRYIAQDEQALQLRRERNQLHKIGHTLRLGRLLADLERDGPADLLARYRKLRACESAPF